MLNKKNILIKYFIPVFSGIILGGCLVFGTAIVDLRSLGLSLNIENCIDIIRTQKIYITSAMFFPVLFGFVFFLIQKIFNDKELAIDEKRYIEKIFNNLAEIIILCDSDGKLLRHNFKNEKFFIFSEKKIKNLIIEHIKKNDLNYELEEICNDKKIIWNISITDFVEKNQYILVLKDVSNFKSLEKKLEVEKKNKY